MSDTYCIINITYIRIILICKASNSGLCKMTVTEERVYFSHLFCFVSWQEYSYFRW